MVELETPYEEPKIIVAQNFALEQADFLFQD